MIEHHVDEGLRKLTFSDQYSPEVGVGLQLVEDTAVFGKTANVTFDCTSDALKPDKDHVGIHAVALGDFEHYGMNRNGDGFPKKACQTRHDTFVTHGHVFVGHKNSDREHSVGQIVKSAYNEPMGRIQLFLHAHKDKAQSQLHKLAQEGSHSFSMACRVPFDRCDMCNTLRKSAADPNQCEHIRDSLGQTFPDGKVACTQNDYPTWFDMSFVSRPADRIAWNLKVAMEHGTMDAVKQAESSGLWVPDALEYDVPGYKHKFEDLQKLAAFEAKYQALEQAGTRRGYDRYLWDLRKAAAYELTDAHVDCLRRFSPEQVFSKLAEHGVIMDAATFFKFALGTDYDTLSGTMPAILDDVRSELFTRLYKQGSYQRACRNAYFDVDTKRMQEYGWGHATELSRFVSGKIASAGAFVGAGVEGRIIEATICGGQPHVSMPLSVKVATENQVHRGAEIYAAYKLSALSAMAAYHKQANADALLALAAVQNLVK
jgi:hypothetical protein